MKAPLPGSGARLLLAEPTARPHRTGVPDCPPRGQAERCLGVGPPGLHGDPYTQPRSRARSRRSEGPGLMARTSVRAPGSATATSGDITLLTVFNDLKKCRRPRWWLSGEESPCQRRRHAFSPCREKPWCHAATKPARGLLRLRSRFWEPQTLKPGRPGHRAPQGETPSQREVRTPQLKTQHGQNKQSIHFSKTCNPGFTGHSKRRPATGAGSGVCGDGPGDNRPGASPSGPHANANPSLPALPTPHLLTKEQNASADSRTSVLWKNAQASPTAV